jgi:hypothetical protein
MVSTLKRPPPGAAVLLQCDLLFTYKYMSSLYGQPNISLQARQDNSPWSQIGRGEFDHHASWQGNRLVEFNVLAVAVF